MFHLTDGPGAGFDDVWTMLRAANRTVACGGSMNAKGFADPNSFFLPDPWCNSEPADPPALNAYQRFVSALVQQYTNTTTGLDATDYARVMAFLATHGLKPGTVREIVAQLASRRLGDSRVSWRCCCSIACSSMSSATTTVPADPTSRHSS
ncbi:MAG: hypothetical protein R3E87_12250 [Burkholderiaceae bacterium]